MRALLFTGPSHGSDLTEIVDVDPPRPGPGEITIDVTHAGLNYVDVMARRGDAAYVSEWPYRAGFEAAGTVREVGAGVTDLSPGQPVAALTVSGGLAQVARARADLTAQLPDGLPARIAASGLAVYATAFLLLTEAARFRPGDRVLMHSASGGVGAAVAGAARVLGGGTLIGTVGRPEKVEVARHSGYDLVVKRTADFADIIAQAVGAIDIVLDAMGTSLLETDLGLLAPNGQLILFGNAGGQAFDPLPPVGRLLGANVSIGGFSISALTRQAPAKVGSALARGLELLAGGHAAIEITDVDGLDAAPEYQDLISKGHGIGKYVVAVQPA